MNPMLTALIVALMGLVCGLALAVAAKYMAVKEDPRVVAAEEVLPGANCGGCGFAGCADYAKAVVLTDASINLCAPGGAEVVGLLAKLMGVTAEVSEKNVAVVMCGGDSSKAPRKQLYNGVADCAAAHAVGGGDKKCAYGCLGYGSCARVCPVGAIEITEKQLAVVHPELCIGCQACVKACPRNLIKMVPVSRSIHVLCSSKDKGPVVKKACEVGCIGCRLCVKLSENVIGMDGFLAVVDYAKPLDNDQLTEKCPGHCIIRRELNA